MSTAPLSNGITTVMLSHVADGALSRLLQSTSTPTVFIEDAAVMFGELAVITRPGAPERRGETTELRGRVRQRWSCGRRAASR